MPMCIKSSSRFKFIFFVLIIVLFFFQSITLFSDTVDDYKERERMRRALDKFVQEEEKKHQQAIRELDAESLPPSDPATGYACLAICLTPFLIWGVSKLKEKYNYDEFANNLINKHFTHVKNEESALEVLEEEAKRNKSALEVLEEEEIRKKRSLNNETTCSFVDNTKEDTGSSTIEQIFEDKNSFQSDKYFGRNSNENCTKAKLQSLPNSRSNSLLKKCVYCAEMIQKDAIFCKHCGKHLVSAGSKELKLLMQKAFAQVRNKEYKEALEIYQCIIEIETDRGFHYRNISYIYYKLGDSEMYYNSLHKAAELGDKKAIHALESMK